MPTARIELGERERLHGYSVVVSLDRSLTWLMRSAGPILAKYRSVTAVEECPSWAVITGKGFPS